MRRRTFVVQSALAMAALPASSRATLLHAAGEVAPDGAPQEGAPQAGAPPAGAPPFTISLAQWSFHKALFAKQMDHLDFARVGGCE